MFICLCVRSVGPHRLTRQMVSTAMRPSVYSNHIQDWLAEMVTLRFRNEYRPLPDIAPLRLVHIQTLILFPDCCGSQLYVSVVFH
jgi:hypothetical protein